MDNASNHLPGGSSQAKGWILLGVVFLLGMVCGASLFYAGQQSILRTATRPFRPRGPFPPDRRPPLEHLARELRLDPQQREEVQAIMEESRLRMRDVIRDSRQQIRALLSPEQQENFDKLRPRRGRGPRRLRGEPPEPPPPDDLEP